MQKTEAFDGHDKFRELCALEQCDALSEDEQLELDRHLKVCESCRRVYAEFSVIGEDGMAYLLSKRDLPEELQKWDDSAARQNLRASIRRQRSHRVLSMRAAPRRAWGLAHLERAVAIAAMAACALAALTLGAYRMGERTNPVPSHQSANLPQEKQSPVVAHAASLSESLAQTAQISGLERQISDAQDESARLRAELIVAQQRIEDLGAANDQKQAELRRLTEQRDQLAVRLAEVEKTHETLQANYANLNADYNRNLLRTASMESDLTSLQAANRDQDRRLKDDEQYLMSDRDIRELMGARKLYIADVFDVDSVSRTRKPFGRVFYTQSKSLVFYAFDLDHQPGVKNASVFQVWGQRDAEGSGATHPMNLGILYMDSESNRRWVLRSDDPKQLAEIDAVFVTVEPHGGSQKPTGKPLLYALLRKEANHP